MKLQLFIISALFLSAFALPVPDEEVSPIKAVTAVEAKTDAIPAAGEKPIEEVKPITRDAPAAELKAEEKKPEKLELPQAAPDAEIAQPLPEKKEELKITEKQTRAEDKADNEPKALPVVEGPVAGVETNKQIVDEIQPAVQEVQPAAKSADIAAAAAPAEAPAVAAAEQKKEELSVAESAPALKSDNLAAETAQQAVIPIAAEEKKDEQPARQERGTEEKVQEVVAVEEVKPVEAAPVVPVNEVVVPENKRAKLEISEEEKLKVVGEPAKEIDTENAKLLQANEKPAETLAATPVQAAGDIEKPQAEQSITKALPALQTQEAPAAVAAAAPTAEIPAIEAKKIEGQPLAKAAEEPALEAEKPAVPALIPAAPAALAAESTEPLKKLEEKPALAEENKSEESKESKESESESKESGESKEDKSN